VSTDDGIEALALLLGATNKFAEISAGIGPTGEEASGTTPFAAMRPVRWKTEEGDGDEPGNPRTRTVYFEVEITTRIQERPTASELEEVVQETLHGAQVLQTTRCVCQAGAYKRFGGTKHPQHRLTVIGEFDYYV
jgi:hypothetical protein